MMLRQVADSRQRGFVADGSPQDRAPSLGGAHHRHHDLDQRGLAGPIGSEQPEDLAVMNPHLDPTQGMDLPLVDLLYMVEIDCVLAV